MRISRIVRVKHHPELGKKTFVVVTVELYQLQVYHRYPNYNVQVWRTQAEAREAELEAD